MNFTFTLAHFCELHGPTSILCTRVVPPACVSCFAPSETSLSPQSTAAQITPTPPHSSHGQRRSNANDRGYGSANAGSPRLGGNDRAAIDTPPSSPRSPQTSLPGLGGISGSGASDECRSCSIHFPKSVFSKVAGGTSGAASAGISLNGPQKSRTIKSRETVVVDTVAMDGNSAHGSRREQQEYEQYTSRSRQTYDLASSTSSEESDSSSGSATHTHMLTYLSTKAPSIPSRYLAVRQSCVRTLSCELVPAQTGPMLFGDQQAGYTIAFVFRLSDLKARGGRRTYALICMCPEQRPLVRSWELVVQTFSTLVTQIKALAARKAAEEAHVSALSDSLSSGPERFLRRRVPSEGMQKNLAELVGKEDIFFDIHKMFAGLLSHLTKLYGYSSYGVDFGTSASSRSLAVSPQEGGSQTHSRSGSISSSAGDDRYTSQDTMHRRISARSTRSLAQSTAELTRATSGLSVSDAQSHGYTNGSAKKNSSRREEDLGRGMSRQQVTVGY